MKLPEPARLSLVFGIGVVLAAFANWAIYTLAYFPRAISPWSPAAPEAPRRFWFDRLPILGWLTLRRESELHGGGFWIRPLLLEVAFPCGLAAYYLYVTDAWALFPPSVRPLLDALPVGNEQSVWMHVIFASQVPLAALMLAATFIDFDEQTVPDWITIPGTLLGMMISSVGVSTYLPFLYVPPTEGAPSFEPLLLSAPGSWAASLSGREGLWVAVAAYSLWCFALADRRLILRRGLGKAVQYFFAGLVRHPSWKILVGIWVLGLAFIGGIYAVGGDSWRGLLTSLVGLAAGGGIVWAVRLMAGVAMRQEAMGFGDVTLMAMIGAFVGWQVALFAFVLAPMTAVLIVLVQFLCTRNRVTPFGPYLCAGTVVTCLFWPWLWEEFGIIVFGMGTVLIPILLSMLLLMGAMLGLWRIVRDAILS